MFPHNYNTKAEFNAYVAEYKDLLNQQIANNQKNFAENMLYINTGVQVTTPADTRSLDEKMMDTQKILSELRPRLLQLTDGVYTSQILNQLQDNPNLLRFVYNSWPRIESYMKTNFARGVTALIFMNYINEQVKVTTKEVGQSPYHIFRPKVLESSQKLLTDIISMRDVIKQKAIKKLYEAVIQDIKDRNILYENLVYLQNEINMTLEPFVNYDIELLLEEINKTENNIKISQDALDEFIQWDSMQEAVFDIDEQIRDDIRNQPDGVTEEEALRYLNEYRNNVIIEHPIELLQEQVEAISKVNDKFQSDPRVKRQREKQDEYNTYPEDIPKPPKFEKRQPSTPAPQSETYYDYFLGKKPPVEKTPLELRKAKQSQENIFESSAKKTPLEEFKEKKNLFKEKTGKGLAVRTPRQPRVKIEGKVQKPPLYIPLGKNIINRNDLNKGVLKIRGASGGALVGFDTQAISSDLSEILKQIANGDIPSDSVLDGLDNDDKQLLHKIISKSRMEDKIKVKDINYDKIEREYRRYLLLRGEVLAGNNNIPMIQELKRLIIKLMNAGRLPKAQSNMALQELALMGL